MATYVRIKPDQTYETVNIAPLVGCVGDYKACLGKPAEEIIFSFACSRVSQLKGYLPDDPIYLYVWVSNDDVSW